MHIYSTYIYSSTSVECMKSLRLKALQFCARLGHSEQQQAKTWSRLGHRPPPTPLSRQRTGVEESGSGGEGRQVERGMQCSLSSSNARLVAFHLPPAVASLQMLPACLFTRLSASCNLLPLLLHVASCGLAGSHSSAYFTSLADLLDSHPIKL